MHDHKGDAGAPEARKIYVLKATNSPARPTSCALLPGA
jgi:hypothetical protein